MPTDKPRFIITVDDEMFVEIENFRFENRYQSRSKAALELIRLGLDVIKKDHQKSEYKIHTEAAHNDGEWTDAHERDAEKIRQLARAKKEREARSKEV